MAFLAVGAQLGVAQAPGPAMAPLAGWSEEALPHHEAMPNLPYPDADRALTPGQPADIAMWREGSIYGVPSPTWSLLPQGLLYPAYLAGIKQSRLGAQWVYVRDQGWFLDSTLGAHIGFLRYGDQGQVPPEGWQLDVEGAAFPRVALRGEAELRECDYRIGAPLTYRRGPWEGKLAYYHFCAHLGDTFALKHPSFPRRDYIRDSLVLGLALRPWPDLRCYYEVGYGFSVRGAAEPWEFQFGIEYSPLQTRPFGSPFIAVNSHLRQENEFGGNVTLETGWQWRTPTFHLMRVGLHYFNGLSEQYQFFSKHEDQLGIGLWYDF